MNKHTPGPHQVVGTTVYALEFDSWHKGKEQMRNRIWANVQGYRDTPKEELEATAKLYAAAPDLLEALIEVVRQYENVRAAEGYPSSESESTKRAKAAITKATQPITKE